MSHNPSSNIREAVENAAKRMSLQFNYIPRNPERINVVLSLLSEYWKRTGYNDLRLGQILCNFGGERVYNMEDSELIVMLEKALNTDNA